MSAPDRIALEYERLVRREQREQRLPAVTAAVVRDGDVVWETAVGVAEVADGTVATPDTQFRVGSITKTFTAAAIMQLRDAGKLDLEDTLDRHVEGASHAPTLRRLLSHASGLQRETHDEGWVRARFADVPELVETLDRAEQVLPSGARFHYSNLAFALLGVVVERASGRSYADYVREHLLEPLGLRRLGFAPESPAATGYMIEPYTDVAVAEPPVEPGAWIAAGQMWGTVRDLCRWAWFLAEPDESVLAKSTVEEMRTVQTISDHVRWTGGYGLGLMLVRDGERILVGHGGAMPGFIASVLVSPGDRVGAAALTNSSQADVSALTTRLVATSVERWPVFPKPWLVEEAPPADVVPLLGVWFMEGDPVILRWREGALEARFPGDDDWRPSAVIRRVEGDLWRVASGWEQGETLRVERDADGAVVRFVLAGYPVLREPRTWV